MDEAVILRAVHRAIEDTRSHDAGSDTPWMANRRVFRFCQYLLSAVDSSTPSRALRPYLRIWYDACAADIAEDETYDGSTVDLTFESACAQFAYLWDRARVEHAIGDFWAMMASQPEPECVKGYETEPVRRLASAMYHASRHNEKRTFHLSQADAGRIMGRSQPVGRYTIALFVADGLIEQLTRGHTGVAPLYRWLRG